MSIRVGVVAAAAVACLFAIATEAQRLPSSVVPSHYDIHFAPDFVADTFAGRVTIDVRIENPTTSVTLNAAEIEVHEAVITSGTLKQPARVAVDAERETVTFTVERPIAAGNASIFTRYSGILNDKLRGLYLSRAKNRKYAITQLEATDARRAFPSFDEPALKATFAVSATIDKGDTAISNGRVIADTPGPDANKHTVRFATTKRMSPYLVALAVGDWECLATTADRIPVRVCGTAGSKDQLGFALEASAFALRYFNRYFDVDYPFDKLDIVAVPDFAAGAMENTGAIFFREQFMLVGKDGSTELRKQVTQYLAHEIAHQWFGDLVTMRWWNDIWLNEGFATWLERRPMEEWKPDWEARLDEVRDTQSAMNLDAMESTRPIQTPADTPQEINQVFDSIAYQKTGAVVRMVEAFVGAPEYQRAINAYVKKYAFGNADGEGFWTTIASVSGKPVDRIFSSYITQSSMPLVSVATRCSGSATELTLSQKPISPAVAASTTWDIPVCYKRPSAAAPSTSPAAVACSVLSEPTATVRLDGCSPWLFANADGRGYYRTSYGTEGLRTLGQALRSGQLAPTEQTSLLEDVWALVRLKQERIADYLALSNDLMSARPSGAVVSVLSRFEYISDRFVDEPMRSAWRQWIQDTLRPSAKRLGWSRAAKESDETGRIRASVLYTLGYSGRDPEVLAEARRRVELHLNGTMLMDASISPVAFQLAAIQGDEALYNRYLERMARTATPEEAAMFRSTLPFFSQPALTARTFALAMSRDVRSQDAPYIISQMIAMPWSSASAWDEVKRNWATLEKSLGVFQGIPALVGATRHFCSAAEREDAERFFRTHTVRGTERILAQSLEAIDRCIEARDDQLASLKTFLGN